MPVDKKKAGKITNSTPKEVSKNWHQAREDARNSGHLNDRPATTPSNRSKNEPSIDTWGDFFNNLTGGGKKKKKGGR
jgi:hypothetical protein